MKLLAAALTLALTAPAFAASGPHPFNANDLVMMDRVSDPAISPDGQTVAFGVRETDYAGNRGMNGVWVVPIAGGKPTRLTDKALNASSAKWSTDGKSVYFLAPKGDTSQLWRVSAKGGAAETVTNAPLDVGNYKLSPDGKRVLLTMEIFTDCGDVACTVQRLDDQKKSKASGRRYDKLFVRHWDTWADGRRSQLFAADIGADGKIGEPTLLSKGIDGDIPSKPQGDDSEFSFSPDGKTVFFDARIAGRTEPWSTNFDIFAVPADGSVAPANLTAANQAWDGYPVASRDGKTLYYLAMKRPTFEADRFGIMALDLASGQAREIDAQWDRSPSSIKISADGKTLYVTADDNGDGALFAIDTATGKPTRLVGDGTVIGFDVGAKALVVAKQDFKHPTDLFRGDVRGKNLAAITHFNAERLKDIRFGDAEFFTFKGWNNETVQGYAVKPVGYRAGKKYPVAFIIHGGPQGAMTNDFHYRWNAQTYAGAGFGVVTINFHGSTGYGQAFTDSISGDWGGKPLEDLQKGWAAALKKFTWLDGGHACALGASYGGYMVDWIAGNWNDPWKCLVTHDGVFDKRMMSFATEELWFDEWENQALQWEKPENVEKYNPVNHVAQWRVPMLVIHSEKDFRIPIEQGIAAFTAAQRRGIPSEFLTFPDENHWVLKPQNSVLWNETVLAWLKRWTAPDAH